MSTYLNFSVQNRQQLADWIERKLGAPLVVVELTSGHLEDAIDEATEIYTKYVTPDQRYYGIDLSTFPSSGYTMPPDSAGVFAIEGQPMLGSASFSGLKAIVGNNSGIIGGGWITYELAMQHLELTERMTAAKFDFNYNHHTKVLNLYPTPFNMSGWITVGVNCIRPESQSYGEYWVKRYALALAKITLGYVRSHFQGTQLLGGATIEGETIKAEGIAERDQLMIELRKSEALPTLFFVG